MLSPEADGKMAKAGLIKSRKTDEQPESKMDGLEDTIAQLKACIDDDDFEFAPSGADLLECLERCQDEISDLKTDLHYCNGVSDLAMKHRDIAEAEIDHLHDEADEYRAEVDRYRDALKRLSWDFEQENFDSIEDMQRYAEQALKPTESNDE